MLDQEFKYFLEHKEELVRAHLGKFLAIKGETVVGVYNSEAEAYVAVVNKGELGNVLIQQCLPTESSYSQHFHSRVIF